METQKTKTEKERKNLKTVVTFRIIQAFSLGLFAFGLSMAFGDYTESVDSPLSSFSTTTTIFGLFGSIITEILARKSENW